MLVQCPHCHNQLKLSENIIENLKKIPTKKTLKVQCVHCRETFGLNGTFTGQNNEIKLNPKTEANEKMRIKAPQPPNLDWLTGGEVAVKKAIEGIPRALVIFPDINEKKPLIEEIEGLGYQVEEPDNITDAIARIFSIDFSLIFYHIHYDGTALEESKLHHYICQMPMGRRRDIFYVLVGDEMKTLYYLQALVQSANLVVNDAELPHIATILKKSIPEYEELFGAFMEELRIVGK